ncbi:oxaloacetate decarboxylase subunit gamma [Psychromonas sp. MME2]|uniref:oxaloacetate decarboxylase subunit gamma n=1 Tax=unclassified Psychromonas TaxID=2614957 RepID=UPI00339C331F
MDVTESLLEALVLMGLGMGFVFLFLGLLMVVVSLMAKYTPADLPVTKKAVQGGNNTAANTQISPQLIAAMTTAVQQYRKSTAQ